MGNNEGYVGNKVSHISFNGIDDLNRLFRNKAKNSNNIHTAEFKAMEDDELQSLFEEMEVKHLEVNLDVTHKLTVLKQDLSNIVSQHQYIHSKKEYIYSKS